MAVIRATASATTTLNASTNTTTTVEHSVVLLQREAGIIGRDWPDCKQQCKHIEKIEDMGTEAKVTRTLLHFACDNKDNSNGEDAEKYKSRFDKFDCDTHQTVTGTVTVTVTGMLIKLMLFLNSVLYMKCIFVYLCSN